ncbi:hypothetical protein [Hymenobacter actinosclerus]|uniref:Uracil DNA glycosylase superfamily protein n=1 Tax=Hymenobacter actinosclerus TaxID=82805 RepID=A0A1I0EZ81_9BACT|nr:hypothetical protein [Hymenobacter actinosclerus]SET50261.1 hypothetical protein SAMN04487998_2038 [Hymenobacter actinosclerus]
MESFNKYLESLYASKWQDLFDSIYPLLTDDNVEDTPACPLLLKVEDEEFYSNADIRIMIFGQETNSWYEPFHKDMNSIIGYYDKFFNSGECWHYSGQFWNGVSRFVKLIKERHPDKSIALLWNNITKIGRHEGIGFPSAPIHQVEREHFSIIPQEIEILKPNIILFLTGPNYDSVISEVFGDLNMNAVSDDFTTRQLARLELPNVGFAVRTYHPGYLWRNDIDKYFDVILNEFDRSIGVN